MIISRVSALLFLIPILLFISPSTSAIGDVTVDIYETEREVHFSDNQTSQTIYMDGIVNYTGFSASGDTIELSTSFNLGESSVYPEQIIFQTTGSEEFTVELIIPNIYENETIGSLLVSAMYHGVASSGSYIPDEARITIINHTDISNDNNNFNNSENHQQDDFPTGITGIFMISIIIIIITIIVIVFYKKKLK